MSKDRARIFFIAAGLLDLVSVYRLSGSVLNHLQHFHFSTPGIFISLAWLFLYASLLISGVLLIIGKRAGMLLFYFQYPLKLAFVILTLGFMLPWLSVHLAPLAYKIALGIIIGVETVRLLVTIMNRK